MKIRDAFFQFAALLTLEASAIVTVISNVAPSAEATALLDASGAPLAAGSQVWLGTFPGCDDPQITSLAAAGSAALLEIFTPLGTAFSIGDGVAGQAGKVEGFACQPSAQVGETLHVIIGDAVTIGASSELLVLKFPLAIIPQDLPGGIDAYLAAHVRDAIVIYGSSSAAGVHTAPQSSAYNAWISAHLPDAAPADLEPGADPDLDGRVNIFEYSQGTNPTAAPSSADQPVLAILVEAGVAYVVFNRRLHEPALSYMPKVNLELGATWDLVTSSLEVVVYPTPPGYERVRLALPTEPRQFVRLTVEYDP